MSLIKLALLGVGGLSIYEWYRLNTATTGRYRIQTRKRDEKTTKVRYTDTLLSARIFHAFYEQFVNGHIHVTDTHTGIIILD